MSGSSGNDYSLAVESYSTGAISAGYYNGNFGYVSLFNVNGSITWQKVLPETVTFYHNLQFYQQASNYVYVAGYIQGTIDGKTSSNFDFFVARHFVLNGTRDTTGSIVLANGADTD